MPHLPARTNYNYVFGLCLYRAMDEFSLRFSANKFVVVLNPERDRSVTTAKVSNNNQFEHGSNLIRSLYF